MRDRVVGGVVLDNGVTRRKIQNLFSSTRKKKTQKKFSKIINLLIVLKSKKNFCAFFPSQ